MWTNEKAAQTLATVASSKCKQIRPSELQKLVNTFAKCYTDSFYLHDKNPEFSL